jgi:hypothetical protein
LGVLKDITPPKIEVAVFICSVFISLKVLFVIVEGDNEPFTKKIPLVSKKKN